MKKRSGFQKLGIVISGWPAVGKTTVAREMAREFGLKLYNGGDILKMIAKEKGYSITGMDWWDTDDAKKFMAERKANLFFDKKVDEALLKIMDKENAVITSYTLPWLVNRPFLFKIWLKGSENNRAQRMADRDGIRLDAAQRIIKVRDSENKVIYRNLYGFNFGSDLTVFDFFLNTDLINLKSLIEISISTIKHILSDSKTH